jgi:hypothetical protein
MGLLFCKWWMTAWMSLVHPFYLSVTEIRHHASKKELEVSCRIFADDFEKTLKSQYKTTFDIIHPTNRKQVDTLIKDYLSKHLIITINDKVAPLSYLGYKIEEDAAWCFLEVANIPTAQKVQIKNDILYEAHPNQINMIHVVVNDTRQSTKLDNPQSDALFKF